MIEAKAVTLSRNLEQLVTECFDEEQCESSDTERLTDLSVVHSLKRLRQLR